eukprot:1457353-Prorocentrum_lima.AAC.1
MCRSSRWTAAAKEKSPSYMYESFGTRPGTQSRRASSPLLPRSTTHAGQRRFGQSIRTLAW